MILKTETLESIDLQKDQIASNQTALHDVSTTSLTSLMVAAKKVYDRRVDYPLRIYKLPHSLETFRTQCVSMMDIVKGSAKTLYEKSASDVDKQEIVARDMFQGPVKTTILKAINLQNDNRITALVESINIENSSFWKSVQEKQSVATQAVRRAMLSTNGISNAEAMVNEIEIFSATERTQLTQDLKSRFRDHFHKFLLTNARKYLSECSSTCKLSDSMQELFQIKEVDSRLSESREACTDAYEAIEKSRAAQDEELRQWIVAIRKSLEKASNPFD